jgi:hypothetical protein
MNVTVASNSDCNATLNNIMTDQMMCTRGAADSGICTVNIAAPFFKIRLLILIIVLSETGR